MKTKITFKQKTKTKILIMRDKKEIGHLYSESETGGLPYPHSEKTDYCLNSIQFCGFDSMDGTWACGIYEGKKDLVIHFRNDSDEYMQQKIKEYEKYLKSFVEASIAEIQFGKVKESIPKLKVKKDITKLMNFDDWVKTIGAF